MMGSALVAVAAVIFAVGLVSVGNGLVTVLLPVRMTLEQLPTVAIGPVVSSYTIGFFAGGIIANRLIRRVGHVRAFCGGAGLLVVFTLAFTIDVSVPLWFVLRGLSGFTGALLFIVMESWLNDVAPNERRGRIMAFYFIAQRSMAAVGALLFAAGNPMGHGLFMLAACAYALCLVPLALNTSAAPTVPTARGLELGWLWRLSPVAVVGAFASGIINNGLVGIGPVYAQQVGLGGPELGWFNASFQIASVLLQYPLGRLSDGRDRRRVLLVTVLVSAVLALAVALVRPESTLLLICTVGLFGGINYAIYPLCAAHAADRSDKEHMVAVSGGLLLAWSVGATLSPMIGTMAMQWLGPAGLFWYLAVACATFAAYIAWRIGVRPPPPKVSA
jgi:MFS family permease